VLVAERRVDVCQPEGIALVRDRKLLDGAAAASPGIRKGAPVLLARTGESRARENGDSLFVSARERQRPSEIPVDVDIDGALVRRAEALVMSMACW